MRYPKYKYFYAITDFISLSVSFFITNFLYGKMFYNPFVSIHFIGIEDITVLIIVNLMFIIIFHYFHLYKINVFLTIVKQTVVILRSLVYGIFIILSVSFFVKYDFISESRLIIAIYSVIIFLILFLILLIILKNLY